VEAACRWTDQLGQPAFGGHVDVFQVPVFRNAVCLVLGGNLIQPARDQRGIIRRYDSLDCQHVHMGF